MTDMPQILVLSLEMPLHFLLSCVLTLAGDAMQAGVRVSEIQVRERLPSPLEAS